MPLPFTEKPKSPRETANWLSIISFAWIWPLLWKGYHRQLEMEDIYRVPPEAKAAPIAKAATEAWRIYLKECYSNKKEPSLVRFLSQIYGWKFVRKTLLYCVNESIFLLGCPLSLSFLLHQLQEPEVGKERDAYWIPYVAATGIILSSIWFNITHHYLQFSFQNDWTHMRIACSALIYQKCMNISQTSLGSSYVSEAVSLLSTDVSRLDELEIYCIFLPIAPIQLGISLVVLYIYFGYTGLIGLILLVVYMPVEMLLGYLFSKTKLNTSVRTDYRLRILTEIFNNIKIIKMYGWEEYFMQRASKCRKEELYHVKKTAWLRAVNSVMSFTLTKLIAFLTLLCYVITNPALYLSPKLVFVTLALYENLRFIVTTYFPRGVEDLVELLLVLTRILRFLMLKEKKYRRKYSIETNEAIAVNDILVDIQDCTFEPVCPSAIPLMNINLKRKGNGLVMLIGPVGAGKTSILQAIWGDLAIKHGSMVTRGNISYLSGSDPWVFRGTVKENILFGLPYDERWYKQVLEACAIIEVIAALPNKESTRIDSISINKGHMCRISLARAVYSDAHIYLLDDCLVHIDTHAARRIMENCFRGILRKKLLMFTTTQLQFLENADYIVLLHRGKIRFQGTYPEFKDQQSQLIESRLNDELDTLSRAEPENITVTDVEDLETGSVLELNSSDTIPVIPNRAPDLKADDFGLLHITRSTEEMDFKKAMGFRIYTKFVLIGTNYCGFILFIVVCFFTLAINSGSEYWLEIFTQTEENRYKNEVNSTIQPRSSSHANSKSNEGHKDMHHVIKAWYLYLVSKDRTVQTFVFGGFIIALFVISLLRTIFFFWGCVRTSTNAYTNLMISLLKAPLNFFDLNTTSRILNRLSQDINTIDDHLPPSLYELIDTITTIGGVLFIVSAINPYFFIPSIFIIIITWLLQVYHQKTVRSLKRLEGISRNPILTTLATTLRGLSTIHSFQQEEMFYEMFYNSIDTHTATWYLFLASQRWVGFVIGWFSTGYIAIVIMTFLFIHSYDDPAAVGLGIHSAITLTQLFQWQLRMKSEVDAMLVSVERIVEFSAVEPEADWETKTHILPSGWPNAGEIVVTDVSVHNSEHHLLLDNISFHILPRQKIGVVGRTGCGKSLLMSTLLRIIEPSSGTITFDGIDITTVGLHDLRRSVAVVPAEPELFLGTVRDNYDPFGRHDDEELWDVIKNTYMLEGIKLLPLGLDTELDEEVTTYFTLAQKQLLCLGRALLNGSHILICDLNPESDELVQEIILRKFRHCTVIASAHQLHNAIEFEKLIVLKNGKIDDFDDPYSLLQKTEGAFSELIQNFNPTTLKTLIATAKEVQTNRVRYLNRPSVSANRKSTRTFSNWKKINSI